MSPKRAAPTAQVDPALALQLEKRTGSSTQGSLGAVLSLRPPSTKKFLSARETETIVRQILKRVKAEVGSEPRELNVFGNLGSFVVAASPEFIRKLVAQREIATATANVQSENLMIEPVDSEPADLDP